MKLKYIYKKIHLFIIAVFLINLIQINGLISKSNDNKELTLGAKSLNFLILSDWGRDGINDTNKKTPGQLKIAKQLGNTAKEIRASFLVTCGDNFHGKGVPTVNDPLWKVNFENVYHDRALMIPWYITLGNHDYGGNADAELEYAKRNKRWVEPARYFSFDKKINDSTVALFVILDSSPFIDEYTKDEKDKHNVKSQNTDLQVKWCDSVLRASKAKWKFVFYHHPAYSASMTHGSSKEIQKALVPLFEKYNVDASFSGHDHDLQHSHPAGGTVEYFGCGGGSETRPAGNADFTKFSVQSLGFGVVSLTSNVFKMSFVNEKGETIYQFEKEKK